MIPSQSYGLTELSGTPPWVLSTNNETYTFADALGDSITYNGTSTVIRITGTNVTLNAGDFKPVRTSTQFNELIEVLADGAIINDLRGANLRTEIEANVDVVFNNCDLEIRTPPGVDNVNGTTKLVVVKSSGTVEFNNCRLASRSTGDLFSIETTAGAVRLENCLLVSTGAASEAILIDPDSDVTVIGCTIAAYGAEPIQTNQTLGTLTMYNSILASNSTCLNATDGTWGGLTATHNWFYRPSGQIIFYEDVSHTDAEAFESNSRDGNPLFNDGDETIRGDYTIYSASGPVNIGDSSRNVLTSDLLGNTREVSTIDMGCYEYQPSDNGSCCVVSGDCTIETIEDCDVLLGVWTEGGICVPNPCDLPGACCASQTECTVTLESLCEGTFLGEGTDCDPGACVFGCPPPGYTELTEGSFPLHWTTNNAKLAICDTLIYGDADLAEDGVLLKITASNVRLTGMGVGLLKLETSDNDSNRLLQLARPHSGFRCRDITFVCNINNTAETSCYLQQDDFEFHNVRWEGSDFVSVYSDVTEPLISGALFDSCSFYCPTGVLGFGTSGCAPNLAWENLTITNCSFISEEPCPPGDFDNKPLRIHHGTNLLFNYNTVITRNAGDGFGGVGDDTEPIGFYDILGNFEIGWNYFYTDNNRVSGATGRSGYISIRGWSTAAYVHDNFMRSGYKAWNLGGGGGHIFTRNITFNGMDVPTYGGAESAGVQVSGVDPTGCDGFEDLPPDGNLPGRNRIESNLFVGYGDPIMMSSTRGGDTLAVNTVINLATTTDEAALRFGANCDPVFGTTFVRDNILINNDASVPTLNVDAGCTDLTIDADFNLYWNRANGPIAKWTNGATYTTVSDFRAATTEEDGGIQGDPSLEATIATWGDTLANYRLKAASIAINAGGDHSLLRYDVDLDSLTRIIDSVVDLGAYESGHTGACCFLNGSCVLTTATYCADNAGTYNEGVDCDPVPCIQPVGACCNLTGVCVILDQTRCTQSGGTYKGNGSLCSPNPCAPPSGACCFTNGTCQVLTSTQCALSGGTFLGYSVPCSEPCLSTRWEQPTVGPKRHLAYVRPRNLIDPDAVLTDAEAQLAATYDFISSARRADEIIGVRQYNSNLIGLWATTFFGVADLSHTTNDYDDDGIPPYNGFELQGIALQDTAWSPDRVIQLAFIENLKLGVDWSLRSTASSGGDHIIYYGQRVLNFTSFCPTGLWGPTLGLTYRQYAQKVYAQKLNDTDFTEGYDGIWFDSMPPACCFPNVYQNVDYDRDGDADFCNGCVTGGSCIVAKTCDPWVMAETAAMETFMAYLLTRKQTGQIIISGQDWISTASRTYLNGWKSEGWLRQPGTQHEWDWDAWFYGIDPGSPHGMVEAEETLIGGSLPDDWQGVEMSTIDATVNPNNDASGWNHQYARQALGSAMLVDAFFSTGYYDGVTIYPVPEETLWKVVLPAESDTIRISATKLSRRFLRYPSLDPCLLVVDSTPLNGFPFGDAYMYGFGACCLVEVCVEMYENECLDDGGVYFGDDVDCTPSPCSAPDPTGACCVVEVCSITTFAGCAGVYQGDDTTCSPDPCIIPAIGACCLVSGLCVEMAEDDCTTGDYQGDDTVCDPNPCPQPEGACCANIGTCVVTDITECIELNGVYQGDFTDCSPNPCAQLTRACCFVTQDCLDLLPNDCIAQGGSPAPTGSLCATYTCPVYGACCRADGVCNFMAKVLCIFIGGSYQGDDTVCDPNPCPQPTGACCVVEVCSITTSAACSGTYQGNGTDCSPDPCDLPDPTGQCCLLDGSCIVLTEADCATALGNYSGDNTNCNINTCQQVMGGCCSIDGTCVALVTEESCVSSLGTYLGDFTGCAECTPPSGACCLGDASCVILDQETCISQPGDYQGNGAPCDPSPCAAATPGACCFYVFCQILTQSECSEQGGSYQGNGTTCFPNFCEPDDPCCYGGTGYGEDSFGPSNQGYK